MPAEQIPLMSLYLSFYSTEQSFLLIFREFLLTVLLSVNIFIRAQCSDVCCSKKGLNYFVYLTVLNSVRLTFWIILMQTSAIYQLFPLSVTLMVWCKVMSQIKSSGQSNVLQLCVREIQPIFNIWIITMKNLHHRHFYIEKWNCWCVFSVTVWDIMEYGVLHSHC